MIPGIIPARAGFTLRRAWVRALGGDHPRSRGVYPRPDPRERIREGSSPLARGLREAVQDGLGGRRIIPARAGFTVFRVSFCSYVWDHPRSRGVYVIDVPASEWLTGSSPLARGLRVYAKPNDAGARIIPARAGFTEESGTVS